VLKELQANASKAEADAAISRRARKDAELELNNTRIMLESNEKDKVAALAKAREAEDLYSKQQDETRKMIDVLNNQLALMQVCPFHLFSLPRSDYVSFSRKRCK